ncbi:MAG: InlB B-repeat-containing protein, partial [Prevotella sp.]|nr:InlB B-repeat-containing protein [Prevotella sp.]
MPFRDLDGGFYAVETYFRDLVGGFYAVGARSESSSAPSTPLAPAPETSATVSTPTAPAPETTNIIITLKKTMTMKTNITRFCARAAATLAFPLKRLPVALLMMLTTATAWADITPATPTQDADGYYLIGTAAELYGFAEIVNNGNATANAKLTADITVNENVLDANGEANTGDFVQWTPIGNDGNSKTYSGTFDGQGHTISGLYVSGSGWYVGLIGKADGTAVVKNLGIVDSYFSSSNNFLGSIVGGVSYSSSVTLANVYSTSTVKGENWIGGLVGSDGSGSVTIINSYFAGKTSANWTYGTHHDDLVSGGFGTSGSGTLDVVNTFVVGTSQYGTSVTAEQLSDGTVAAALHYYQDALADGSMFGINDGKTTFSGSLEGVSVTTADITLHTFDGDATAYSSKYVVGNATPLPVNVVREGYTFLGWYDNANLEGDAVTSISSSETGSKEYWAKFERSHSVSFVLNDGYIQTGEIDHYIEGETTALPTMVFKDGASFEGWYTTEDFTG